LLVIYHLPGQKYQGDDVGEPYANGGSAEISATPKTEWAQFWQRWNWIRIGHFWRSPTLLQHREFTLADLRQVGDELFFFLLEPTQKTVGLNSL
jgi:hypothetical protein